MIFAYGLARGMPWELALWTAGLLTAFFTTCAFAYQKAEAKAQRQNARWRR